MDGKILVTGGRGRLARALVATGQNSVCALAHEDLDVTDANAIGDAIRRERPAAVINAAVINGVDESEHNAQRAWAVNAIGPGLLSQACASVGVPLVHISSDYVFGAPTLRPWREDDVVSPINAYGRMKAKGEQQALHAGGCTCVVRVAWLFGDGEDFIARLLNASDSKSVSVAQDQIGSPTPIYILAARLLSLAERMAVGDKAIPTLLHLAGTPPTSRADWVATALDALRNSGGDAPELLRVSMDSFASAAPRPKYSALDCSLAAQIFGREIDWRSTAADPQNFSRNLRHS